MLYVVAYDVPDDRRRNHIAKALLDFGVRVQESVFECIIDEDRRLREMVSRLQKLANPSEDRIRVVPVCTACTSKIWILGPGGPTTDPEVYVV